MPISGQTGDGLDRLMQAIIDTDKVWNRRISTAKLNRWLETQQIQHPPPAVSGRRLKLKYMTQVKARPPGFMISCTRPECAAGKLYPLPDQRAAQRFRPAGRADPHSL